MDKDGGALRLFRVSVDVRSFKAGSRLPMRAANVFVKVVLPAEIVKLALESSNPGNAAKLTAPLRSHPPILVERSSEVTIPNGYVALELPVSVLGLASTLAQDPQLLAEVYHRDRYAADSVIGTARISMAPLMHEPRLDGYVTVRSEKHVTTGSIRIVLAAEELGPVAESHHKRVENRESHLTTPGLEESFLLLKNNISQFLGSRAVAVQTEQQIAASKAGKNKEKCVAVERDTTSTTDTSLQATEDKGDIKDSKATEKGDELRANVEYEMAWEFEMWRRTEEAKWRAELKEKELATFKALEEESRKKQTEQTAAIDKVRFDLANLEAKLRAKLLAVEKRDRALVLAEEEANLRREALERECAQRVADAEAAVKRIEADCQQRVELEHVKYSMLEQQNAALEQRLANTNAALVSVEKEFTAFKSSQRMSSEVELSAQLLVLKHQCHALEKKTEAALRSRDEYKAQVVRLAKELAATERRRSGDTPKDRDDSILASLIEAHNRKESEEKLELKLLKEQVEKLQAQEQTAVAAATAAAIAAATLSKQATKENENEHVESKPPKEPPQLRTSTTYVEHADAEELNVQEATEESKGSKSKGLKVEQQFLDDGEPFLSQISAFQKAEIVRLAKQKADLLQTGVYTPHDRIIKGLEQEINRLQSIDTAALSLR